MTDLDKRLDKIEQQLQVITNNQTPMFGNQMSPQHDEIDLRELWNVLWQGKWWIIGITFLFALAGVVYALSLPNMYKSEGIYAPAQQQGSMSGLAAQYGGLAAMAGINIGGGESNDIEQAMVLLDSWSFLENLINKYNLKPLVMGVESWDKQSDTLTWDVDIYNPDNQMWTRIPKNGELPEPSSYETYKEFKGMISADLDEKIGLLRISVEYYSPKIAKDWVDLILVELNAHFRDRDKQEATRSIEFLERKITETNITEMQTVFYDMLEAQTKTLMLTEVREDYLLKSVVDPKVAELKSQPKRAVLVILALFSGGFFGVIFLFVRYFFKGK